LGHGDSVSIASPKRIASLSDSKIVGIASGGLHSMAWSGKGRCQTMIESLALLLMASHVLVVVDV
jgi:hypothetical protein